VAKASRASVRRILVPGMAVHMFWKLRAEWRFLAGNEARKRWKSDLLMPRKTTAVTLTYTSSLRLRNAKENSKVITFLSARKMNCTELNVPFGKIININTVHMYICTSIEKRFFVKITGVSQ
jgi:hypothetical protein